MHLQKSDDQHATFISTRHDPSRNPRDPNSPPGFHLANLGQQTTVERPLKVQINAACDRCKLSTGIAWVISSLPTTNQRKYGCFSYASSALAAELMTCLKAITWARNGGYLNLVILTMSSHHQMDYRRN